MKNIAIPLAASLFGICLGSFFTWQYAEEKANELLASFTVGEINLIIKALNEPNHKDGMKLLEANLLVDRSFLAGCDKEFCLESYEGVSDALEKIDNYEFKYVSP